MPTTRDTIISTDHIGDGSAARPHGIISVRSERDGYAPLLGSAGILWGRAFMMTRYHLRSYRRFPVQCRIYYSNDQGSGIGTVWNLSMNGWRVDGTLAVRPGMSFTLCVILPTDGSTVFVDRATVRWSRGQEFGVETSAMKETEVRRLKRLVESLTHN